MGIARWTGLTYLFLIATGMFALAYAPGVYFVRGDMAATVAAINASPLLFKGAIAAEMFCYMSFAVLAALFYRMFHRASEVLSILLVGCVWIGVALGFAAIGEKMMAVKLLDAGTSDPVAMGALFDRYNMLQRMAHVFWGLWLLPYGWLVLKTRAIPRVFGVGLIIGSVTYVAGVVVPLFWAGYGKSVLGQYADLPGTFGEIVGALWWTVFGAKAGSVQEFEWRGGQPEPRSETA